MLRRHRKGPHCFGQSSPPFEICIRQLVLAVQLFQLLQIGFVKLVLPMLRAALTEKYAAPQRANPVNRAPSTYLIGTAIPGLDLVRIARSWGVNLQNW